MRVQYKRVDHVSTPIKEKQRREVVRLRDVEKMSWRQIGKELGISFQRVCQIYNRVKEQSGQVNRVKNKEVVRRVRVGRKEQVRTKDLTPDTLDSLIDLESKEPKTKLRIQ